MRTAAHAALSEVAMVTTKRRPAHRDIYWSSILALSANGAFTMRGVLAESGLADDIADDAEDMRRSAHVRKYLSGLVKAGILSSSGHPALYTLTQPQQFAPEIKRDGNPYSLAGGNEGKLTVVIPRNEDGAWMVLKRLAKGGREVTAEAVHEAMQGALPVEAIADYLRRLVKGGYAELAGTDPVRAWRLIRLPAETPRLTLDGRPLKHAAQQDAMWKVIEMSAYFTAADLAQHASTDACDVPLSVAAEYAEHLLAAGYLIKREQAGQDTVYRLLRHTGPMAPRLLKASFVFDPNKNCIYGPGQRVREVRR